MSAAGKFDLYPAEIFKTYGAEGLVEFFKFLFGAFVITKNGIVIAANKPFLEMVGYPKSELYGMSALDLITEDERAAMSARFAEGNIERYELKLLLKSKKILDVLVAPGKFSVDGEVFRLAEFIDNSVQKKSELALRESEQKFHSVFEQAAVGIARVSPDGNFLEVNQKLCDIVGYKKEELVKIKLQEITHPDDLDIDLDLVHQMLNNERDTYDLEKRYYSKDGKLIWVNLTVSLIRSSNGEPNYFIAIIEDINSRKKLEYELLNKATHHALTGLCNRNELNERLENELERAVRSSRSLLLLMIDIDHFKLVNDQYGHLAGDKVLIELSNIFKKLIRRTDDAGRFGGKEFLLVLPELDLDKSLLLAERLRKKVESHSMKFDAVTISVTISIGMSTYPDNGKDIDSLIKACHDAMYEAKQKGRNQIVLAST